MGCRGGDCRKGEKDKGGTVLAVPTKLQFDMLLEFCALLGILETQEYPHRTPQTGADGAAPSGLGTRPPLDLSTHAPLIHLHLRCHPCPPLRVPQQMGQGAVQSPSLNSSHLHACEV